MHAPLTLQQANALFLVNLSLNWPKGIDFAIGSNGLEVMNQSSLTFSNPTGHEWWNWPLGKPLLDMHGLLIVESALRVKPKARPWQAFLRHF